MSQHTLTLLLGSNLGNPAQNITEALEHLETRLGAVLQRSEMLKTAPVEFASSNFFCNIAVQLKTCYSPLKVLNIIKDIEREMGRATDTSISKIYTDRIIDIDVVFFDRLKYISRSLFLPHEKHASQREFSRKLLEKLAEH